MQLTKKVNELCEAWKEWAKTAEDINRLLDESNWNPEAISDAVKAHNKASVKKIQLIKELNVLGSKVTEDWKVRLDKHYGKEDF